MSYIGKSPSQGVRQRYYFTATGGETSLSGADDNNKTLIFSDGEYIDVYLNGVLLVAGTDYATTTTNTISSLAALAASDIVEVVVYDIFSVADTVSATNGGAFGNNITISGDLTVDTNTLYVDSANNRVGIGKTPSTALDVNGTVTATTFVGAGTLHAWANFNQTSTQAINDSVGISSITDSGVGTTTLTFSNSMANTTFTATSGHMDGGTKFQYHDSDSTANVKVINRDVDGGGGEDGNEIATQVAGDAA